MCVSNTNRGSSLKNSACIYGHTRFKLVYSKLAIVSAVSGDFLSVSVALISGEKWGGSAWSLRSIFRQKIWQNPEVESLLLEFSIISVVFSFNLSISENI